LVGQTRLSTGAISEMGALFRMLADDGQAKE